MAVRLYFNDESPAELSLPKLVEKTKGTVLCNERVIPDIRAEHEAFVERTKAHPRTCFWRACFFHVGHMLKAKEMGLLCEGVVRRMYLPVGNPDTLFYFGTIDVGNTLMIRVPNEKPWRLFYVVLDSCSLPVEHGEVTDATPGALVWMLRKNSAPLANSASSPLW